MHLGLLASFQFRPCSNSAAFLKLEGALEEAGTRMRCVGALVDPFANQSPRPSPARQDCTGGLPVGPGETQLRHLQAFVSQPRAFQLLKAACKSLQGKHELDFSCSVVGKVLAISQVSKI